MDEKAIKECRDMRLVYRKEIESLKEQNKIMREAFDKISFLCEEFFDDDHGDGYEFRDEIELALAKCDKITR